MPGGCRVTAICSGWRGKPRGSSGFLTRPRSASGSSGDRWRHRQYFYLTLPWR